MNTNQKTRLAVVVAVAALSAVVLAGCSGEVSSADRARAQVTAKEKALSQAQDDFAAASGAFCGASEDYIVALDRYGDVLNATAPTVGDVRDAGSDLVKPRKDALDSAEAALAAQQQVAAAEQDLADAQARLAAAETGSTAAPAPTPQPTFPPLAPAATIDRVTQAESEFASAAASITDDTPLTAASEQFNSAAVALELSWLRLFVDAGCATDEQQQRAEASVTAYTTALQQQLTQTGHYTGAIDGVYGPQTVQAVESLQAAHDLPVTGTMDKATSDALQAELLVLGGAAAQESVASTAAVQQTLTLLGFWDGPVDGVWTDELTEAVKAFQVELGVEPTGTVDAATVAAFEKALADLKAPDPSPSPTSTPSA